MRAVVLQEDPAAIIDNAIQAYYASAALALEGMHSYDRRALPAAFKTFRKVLPREDSRETLTSIIRLLCSVCPQRREAASSALCDLSRHAVLDLLPVAVECSPNLHTQMLHWLLLAVRAVPEVPASVSQLCSK